MLEEVEVLQQASLDGADSSGAFSEYHGQTT